LAPHAIYDTDFWKSFVHTRLATHPADSGSLTLYGGGSHWRPEHHRDLAEHLTSERRVKTEGRGRTVDEWKLRPGGPDNHWLDCLVGCAVAASMQGVTIAPRAGERDGKRGTASREHLSTMLQYTGAHA